MVMRMELGQEGHARRERVRVAVRLAVRERTGIGDGTEQPEDVW